MKDLFFFVLLSVVSLLVVADQNYINGCPPAEDSGPASRLVDVPESPDTNLPDDASFPTTDTCGQTSENTGNENGNGNQNGNGNGDTASALASSALSSGASVADAGATSAVSSTAAVVTAGVSILSTASTVAAASSAVAPTGSTVDPCSLCPSENGDCDSATGSCSCKSGFSGLQCLDSALAVLVSGYPSNLVISPSILHTPSAPTDSSDENSPAPPPPVQFDIGLLSLYETDSQLNEVNGTRIDVRNVSFTPPEEGVSVGSCNNGATINITMKQFNDSTTVPFGSRNVSFPANSLEIKITLSSWNFSSPSHYIAIVSQAAANVTTDATSNFNNFTSGTYWLSLSFEGGYLYAQYVSYALVDGVEKPLFCNYYEGTVITFVPSFNTTAEVDPNYGVLVRPNNSGSSFPVAIVVGVSVAVIVVVVAVVVGIFVVVPRMRLRHQVHEATASVRQSSEISLSSFRSSSSVSNQPLV